MGIFVGPRYYPVFADASPANIKSRIDENYEDTICCCNVGGLGRYRVGGRYLV